MKKNVVFLLAALPVFLFAPGKVAYAQAGTPVVAQTEEPLVITSVQAQCDVSCTSVLNDGDYASSCSVCDGIYFCFADTSYVRKFEVLAQWNEGVTAVPVLDGEVQDYFRRYLPDASPDGPRWYTFTNLGDADCVLVQAMHEWSWYDPTYYEARAWTGAGSMDVFQGGYWMVNKRVSSTLGSPIVSGFIYAILGLAIGTLGFAMVIRGLFGAAGAQAFDQGSGLGHSGSQVSYPTSEVGDVD